MGIKRSSKKIRNHKSKYCLESNVSKIDSFFQTNVSSLYFFRISTLYEFAMQPEHRRSVGDVTVYDTTITDTGALNVASGVKTGRVPKEKRIVYDDTTKDVS